jgi:hypothetical protein
MYKICGGYGWEYIGVEEEVLGQMYSITRCG